MERIVIRVAINAIAIWVAASIVPGISYTNTSSLLGVALIFGVVNAVLRPLLQLLTCPLILMTLGLFTFVLNAILFLIAADLGYGLGLGFAVEGFGSAFLGALIISVVSVLLSIFIRDQSRSKDDS